MWQIIDSGRNAAKKNMEDDQSLLEGLADHQRPILHLYDWEGDCATFGYFIKPEEYLDLKAVKAQSLSLARRSTGGGIVFHLTDLAFSVLIPENYPHFSTNTLENYAYVNKLVLQVIRKFQGYESFPLLLGKEKKGLDESCGSFCMAKPTRYDVMIEGKKIGGAAQRRVKHGLLHQGTISLAKLPEAYLKKILIPGTRVIEGMQDNGSSLLGDSWTVKDLLEVREGIKKLLIEVFQQQS
jgi:lipoate---protein ligase